MTDGVLVSGGDYALEIFHDEVTFTDIRQLVPAVFVDGNWSRQVDVYGNPVAATALSSTLFPTTTDIDNFLATEALAPIGFIVENIDPTDPGTGGGTVDFNGSDGLPVYSLTAGQAQYLTNGIQPLAGVYAVDVWIDPTTATESRTLVDAFDELGDGNWSAVTDQYGYLMGHCD